MPEGADVLLVQCKYVSTRRRRRNRLRVTNCRRFVNRQRCHVGRLQPGQLRFCQILVAALVVEEQPDFAANLRGDQRFPTQRSGQRLTDCRVAAQRGCAAQNIVVQHVVK